MNPAKMEELGLEPKTGYSAIVMMILDGVITPRGRAKGLRFSARASRAK